MVSSFCFEPLRPIPCFGWRLWLLSFVRPWLCRLFALMDFIGPEYAWMLHDPPGVELQMDEEGKGPGDQEDLGEQGTRGPGPEDQGTKGSGEPEIVFPVFCFFPGNLDFDSSIIPPHRSMAGPVP